MWFLLVVIVSAIVIIVARTRARERCRPMTTTPPHAVVARKKSANGVRRKTRNPWLGLGRGYVASAGPLGDAALARTPISTGSS
jgi:hypothetical protein